MDAASDGGRAADAGQRARDPLDDAVAVEVWPFDFNAHLARDDDVARVARAALAHQAAPLGKPHGLEMRLESRNPGVCHDSSVACPVTAGEGAGLGEPVWPPVFRATLELGGTLTGEHGVGLLKQRWLKQELGSDALDVHHSIKRALDPLGILNPGKAI